MRSVRKNSSGNIETDTRSLAFLFFGMVITFLICTSFQIATNLFYAVFDLKHTMFYQIFLSPRHFMDSLNSCVNFIFYCAFGTKFRAELYKLGAKLKCTICQTGNKTTEEMGSDGNITSTTTGKESTSV